MVRIVSSKNDFVRALVICALMLDLFSTRHARADVFLTNSPLTIARYGHTATLLANGKVLVAGGYGYDNAATNSAELYDPATGTWTNAGSLIIARADHTATLLTN